MIDFWLFPGVLEGLGNSGRLVGSISTLPGTFKSSTLGGTFFVRLRYVRLCRTLNKLQTAVQGPLRGYVRLQGWIRLCRAHKNMSRRLCWPLNTDKLPEQVIQKIGMKKTG